MGELGFLGLDKPVEYGGQGGDYYSALVLAEELVRGHSGGLTMGIAVQTDMALPPILKFGTKAQKRQWAAPAIAARRSSASGSPSQTQARTWPASGRVRPTTRWRANT